MIAANARIYQNTNPILELTLKDQGFNLINLKDATKHNILVIKPSGIKEIWEAEIAGENFEMLSYTVKSYALVEATENTPEIPARTDLNEIGFYSLAPQIELAGLTNIGETFQLQVLKIGI